jgi:hypothetical protein
MSQFRVYPSGATNSVVLPGAPVTIEQAVDAAERLYGRDWVEVHSGDEGAEREHWFCCDCQQNRADTVTRRCSACLVKHENRKARARINRRAMSAAMDSVGLVRVKGGWE